ncbi:MAG TPA: hypothetical protein PK280_10335, partial [Planctomycetota bacterium]|nr:hypothetical protein [Planctomycetota bacterium]
CPTGAISEVDHEIGVVEIGARVFGASTVGAGLKPAPAPAEEPREIGFACGVLKVGQPMSPPLIRAVKKRAPGGGVTIIDCPPGTSCPVIAAVRGADFVLLVTEPTPFGLHDLTLAVETVRKLDLSFGVVINRSDAGDGRVTDYCRREKIPVLLEIPEDRRVAEAYSRGEAMVEALPEYRRAFERLWAGIPDPAGRQGRNQT